MDGANPAPSPLGKFPNAELDSDMQATLDNNHLKAYGFSFHETYRHALRFYKGKICRTKDGLPYSLK